jgi:hypothetical protein
VTLKGKPCTVIKHFDVRGVLMPEGEGALFEVKRGRSTRPLTATYLTRLSIRRMINRTVKLGDFLYQCRGMTNGWKYACLIGVGYNDFKIEPLNLQATTT